MKHILLFTFLLIYSIATGQSVLTGKVVKIADGDTITILTKENSQIKVRLHGIDCPEKSQDFGNRAKQFTTVMSIGKTVSVQIVNKDRYGRTVGRVFLADGKMINKELLKAGLAWHYKKFDKSEEFASLENYAMLKKLGIWSIKNPIAPWDYRKKRQVLGVRD